jgi:hypothetical protein
VPLNSEEVKMSEYKSKEYYKEQLSRDLNDNERPIKEISIVELWYLIEIFCDIRDELKRVADALNQRKGFDFTK